VEERSTMARPYALAAFKQAREEDELQRWSEMLHFLAGVASDRGMKGIISSPKIESDRLAELVIEIAGERLSETGGNFVKVLAEFDRLPLLPEIARVYDAERADFEGRSKVEVISAFELAPQFEQVIMGAMAKRLGRVIDLSVRVDESIIGGVVIRAGDLVIDLSLRGRLKQLALELS